MTRVDLNRIPLDPVTMTGAVNRIIAMRDEPRVRAAQIVTVNAQFMQLARHDSRFAEILRRADLSLADGQSVVWATRLLNRPVPERIAGTDLVEELCAEGARRGCQLYFLGGRPGSADCAAQRLRQKFPGVRIVTDCPSHGFLARPEEEERVVERITLAQPDILFVALGAPLQEYWIEQHLHLPVKVMMGVGGSFELISGFQRRAPRVLQVSGCEWLWRLCREPRRLWSRYLVGNLLFLYIVFRLWLAHKHMGLPFDERGAGVNRTY